MEEMEEMKMERWRMGPLLGKKKNLGKMRMKLRDATSLVSFTDVDRRSRILVLLTRAS